MCRPTALWPGPGQRSDPVTLAHGLLLGSSTGTSAAWPTDETLLGCSWGEARGEQSNERRMYFWIQTLIFERKPNSFLNLAAGNNAALWERQCNTTQVYGVTVQPGEGGLGGTVPARTQLSHAGHIHAAQISSLSESRFPLCFLWRSESHFLALPKSFSVAEVKDNISICFKIFLQQSGTACGPVPPQLGGSL